MTIERLYNQVNPSDPPNEPWNTVNPSDPPNEPW
jgi:hypothetical protein